VNCPHCENELKLNTLIDLVREILAKVSHCPNNGIKEVFDREFARDNASAEATYPADKYRDELDRIKCVVMQRWGHWTDIHGPLQEQETQRKDT